MKSRLVASLGMLIALVLVVIGFAAGGSTPSVAPELASGGWFASNLFASGVFSAGMFSMGIFSAGLFSVGIFSVGLFSFGIFSFGTFSIGLAAWYVTRRRSQAKKQG